MRFLMKWLINVAALLVVIHVVAGVRVESAGSIVVAALVIGLLNSFLRPIMVLVTLPLSILSFGFFTLIINAAIFYLASKFVQGFVVASFWNAFWASLVFSIISLALNTLLTPPVSLRVRSGGGVRPDERPKYDNVIDVEATVEEDNKTDK